MKQEPKHWYLLSFLVQRPGVWTPTSFLMPSDKAFLTVPQLNRAKAQHNVPDASVLISISYLGYMTEREINEQPEVDEPSVLSEEYQQGMVAAVQSSVMDALQPINPYIKVGISKQEAHQRDEWSRGFNAIRAVQNPPKEQVKPTRQDLEEPTLLMEEPMSSKPQKGKP